MYYNWYNDQLLSPVRHIKVRANVAGWYQYSDTTIKEFTVTRIADKSKFFGYGITHKLNLVISELHGEVRTGTGADINIEYLVTNSSGNEEYIAPFPTFYITEVHRDETEKKISITAYDISYQFRFHTVSELNLAAEHSTYDLISAVRRYFNISGITGHNPPDSYKNKVVNVANFEGTETIQEALDAACAIMGSVYFIENGNMFGFWRVNSTANPTFTITKELYYELKVKTNRRLQTVVHTTSLGDNVSYSANESGSTQYLRDNPYLNNDNVDYYLQEIVDGLSGNTYTQYECSWRGVGTFNPMENILIDTDDGHIKVRPANMEVHYDGSFSETIYWEYEDNDEETAANPSTLGGALKQTYAVVDKVNKEIDLVASDVSETAERISSLEINTESISASVSEMEKNVTATIEGITSDIATLTSTVETKISAEDVTILVKSELDNGVTKVVTNTGYTFDDEGLTVSKSDSEMTTTISEDGMTVYKNEEAVLVANNEGVKAEDLHATTYLIIGMNSRFEDYGDRTGCFWIGG